MDKTSKTKPSFSNFRRWMFWFNSALAVLALVALLAMVNYLSGGYYKRFHLDSQSGVRLQPQTMRLLNSLTEDVSVTIFFDPDEELYDLTTSLLREYSNASKHIVVTKLNYTQFQSQAKELLDRHHLTNIKNKNFVLFDSHGHSKIIYAKDLAEYDLTPVLQGHSRELRYKEFRGELLFSSAIFAVTHPQLLKACFLQGHGEISPEPSSNEESHSKLAAILKDETGTDWQTLTLTGTNTIPADCQLLIIAGPRLSRFSSNEIARIDDFLKQGNRLLLLLDNHFSSGIEEILAKYGVAISPPTLTVREQNRDYALLHSQDGSEFFAAHLLPHPTVNPINIEGLNSLHFLSPRYFEVKGNSQAPGAPQVTVIASTSDQATNDREKGMFPLAVAVEQGGIKGVNTPRGGTRIIALGDSLALSDRIIDDGSANHVFSALALNWLMERPEILLSGITARPIKDYRLLITESQMRSIRLIFLGAMPGSVLFIGWLVWLRRRR